MFEDEERDLEIRSMTFILPGLDEASHQTIQEKNDKTYQTSIGHLKSFIEKFKKENESQSRKKSTKRAFGV